jgi:hypothetical protein
MRWDEVQSEQSFARLPGTEQAFVRQWPVVVIPAPVLTIVGNSMSKQQAIHH